MTTDTTTPLDCAPPEPGQLVQLADDLYWMRFRLPFRLNHINLYAFDTDAGWLLLDCGINAAETAAAWEAMLTGPLAGRSVAGIIVSHYHADHVGYAGPLADRTGAPVHMGAVELEQARWNLALDDAAAGEIMATTYARFGLGDDTLARTRATGNYYRKLSADLPRDVITIDPAQPIHTRAGVWQLRFDSGHSPGQLSLFEQDRKLHICVDFLLPRISPNVSVPLRNSDADMLGDYLVYLTDMAALGNNWLIIPGHDWPYFGGGIRARQLIAHHHARLDQLRDAAKTGTMTTLSAMNTLFPIELTDHELFFAVCEARAHLNHLVAIGDLSQTNIAGIDYFSGR